MLEHTGRFDDPQLESLLPPTAINRRGFLAGGAGAGFALAAGPLAAQSVIRTPADGLYTADMKVPTGQGDMPAYLACPVNGARHATVLVVPEIFGMHEYQKDICRRLALRGYTGVTLDPYFRLGELARMTEIREVVGLANRLEDARMLADLDALVAFISAHPRVNAARMGITGMCRGGRTVWMYAAHSKQMKAGVSWYGGLNPMPPAMPRTPIDVAGALNMPVLGLYGGADAGIPVALVARMQEALKAGSKGSQASRFVLYRDMPHAFHADYRPSYRKEAAEDGWQQMLAWFKEHGVA
ncbi:MAG: dienelactone hydrolase family protein [Betaproteobacteria bacterium]|nr:dienelactone hydrolase family protein [Betaproteobacteria bacterium]